MNEENSRRVAVVTGAGAGLGAAIAHRLATDGYTVVLVGRTEATLKQTAHQHPAMRPWVGDVSDLAAITEVMDGVAERFGRLDVLVNNAGVAIPGTVDQIDLTSYRTMMSTNVDGVFFASRAALPTCGRRVAASSTSARSAGCAATGSRPPTTRPRARW